MWSIYTLKCLFYEYKNETYNNIVIGNCKCIPMRVQIKKKHHYYNRSVWCMSITVLDNVPIYVL